MPLDFREVVLLEGETGSIDLNIINAGTEGATSFDYTMTVDGETSEEQTYTFTNPVEDFSAVTIAKIPVVAAPTAKESEVSITIRDYPGGHSKVSVRSGESFDSCALCARFGGGGHKMAAGCNLPVPPLEARELLLRAIDEVLA